MNLGWGGGQALVQKRGQVSDGGGIGKIFKEVRNDVSGK